MNKLRIALTKGRLEKSVVALLDGLGYDMSEICAGSRKLIFEVPALDDGDVALEILLAKAGDVITYVEHGVCDLGVVGKDTILESGKQFYELMDLGFGKCRFALAGMADHDFYAGYAKKVVATKYPGVARDYFEDKGMDIEIIKIEGSVELAPLLGLSDAIVDLVETGSTLKANGLCVYEEICDISARLIANIASAKLKAGAIKALMRQIEKVSS